MSFLDDDAIMPIKRTRYESPDEMPMMDHPDVYSSQGPSTVAISQLQIAKPPPGESDDSTDIHSLEVIQGNLL